MSLFLKRQCDRTLRPGRQVRGGGPERLRPARALRCDRQVDMLTFSRPTQAVRCTKDPTRRAAATSRTAWTPPRSRPGRTRLGPMPCARGAVHLKDTRRGWPRAPPPGAVRPTSSKLLLHALSSYRRPGVATEYSSCTADDARAADPPGFGAGGAVSCGGGTRVVVATQSSIRCIEGKSNCNM